MRIPAALCRATLPRILHARTYIQQRMAQYNVAMLPSSTYCYESVSKLQPVSNITHMYARGYYRIAIAFSRASGNPHMYNIRYLAANHIADSIVNYYLGPIPLSYAQFATLQRFSR